MIRTQIWLLAILSAGGLFGPGWVAAQTTSQTEPVRLPALEEEPPVWTFAPQAEETESVLLMDSEVILNERKPPPKDFGGMGGGGPFGGQGGPGYGSVWYPTKLVKGQDVDFQLIRQNASAALPVWRGDKGIMLMSMNVGNSLFFTDAVLPDSQRPFPAELWRVNLGLNYIHKFDNGSTLVVLTGLGSSSDKPFHSWEEMNFTLGTFWRRPARNERDAWMLGVMYSPSGSLNFPIPAIAYQWNPSDSFQMSVGLPLSVTWHPFAWENWTVSFSYLPLTNGSLMVTHDFTERIHLYSGYQSISDSYFLSDREIERDRFYATELRIVKGLRYDLGRNAVFDICAGYAFDRKYGEGANQGASLHDNVDVQPGEFVEARIQLRF
ncbi:hypothetical protein DTL42_21585 [Bremerella cremea]|uniref:Uncharacterized protein n=1 Tax=Bremerella cremea TaxID=1031537 RepID=A0A368KK69_9BACT|nr:DUF6268 family outer membrane beta-barrel protein [Bremerella cremea]RCS41168.1 hypothetical protein DTL42_21585 [Bremerella cremea]